MNEKEAERRIQVLENQLYCFLMRIDVLRGSVAPFLTIEDIDDFPSKEFSRDIDLSTPTSLPLRCKISLRLMAGRDYQQNPFLRSSGVVPWFLLSEYRQEDPGVVTCLTLRRQNFTTDNHNAELRQCLKRLNGPSLESLTNETVVVITELMGTVENFFIDRIKKVFQGKVDIALFLQNVNYIYDLAQSLQGWHETALKYREGANAFPCLVFETIQALLSTKEFVKSKRIGDIREKLEKRSKEILAKINS